MNLYNKNYKIKSNNQQKEVDIEYIIRLILIEMKKNIIMEIKKTKPSITEKDCNFVISVPAIWDLKSKQIMLEASQNAGLFEENEDTSTFFSLEPEAVQYIIIPNLIIIKMLLFQAVGLFYVIWKVKLQILLHTRKL